MHQYIQKYFAVNKTAVLPGIGYFIVDTNPALLDFADKSITAPQYRISFHADNAVKDDRFYSFLTSETGMTEAACINAFDDFSNAVHHKLLAGEEELLPGIGALQKNDDGYVFHPDNTVHQFFPAAVAEKTVRQNASHTVRVGEDEKTSEQMHQLLNQQIIGEKWWITALVLALAGIAAIAYYHFSR